MIKIGFFIIGLMLFSCSNRRDISTKNIKSYIDTANLEQSLLLKTKNIRINVKYNYFLKAHTSYLESDFYEDFLFDQQFNLVKYKCKWSGEGYIGSDEQIFDKNNLILAVDSTFDSESEEYSQMYYGLDSIKGLKIIITYKKSDDNIYINGSPSLNIDNIAGIKKILLLQADFSFKQNSTISKLTDLESKIVENINSVKFDKKFAKIEIENSNNTLKLEIDSVLFVKITEGINKK